MKSLLFIAAVVSISLSLLAEARQRTASNCRAVTYLVSIKSGTSSAVISSDTEERLQNDIGRFCQRSGCDFVSEITPKKVPGF